MRAVISSAAKQLSEAMLFTTNITSSLTSHASGVYKLCRLFSKFANLVCASAGPGASLPNGSAAPREAHSYPSAPHSGPDAPHINGGYHGGHASARGADPAGSPPPPPPPPPLGHVLGSGGEAGPGLRSGPRYGGESEGGWRAFAGVAGERGGSSRGPGGLLGAHAQLPPAAEAVWHFNGERAPAQVRGPSSSSSSCGPLLAKTFCGLGFCRASCDRSSCTALSSALPQVYGACPLPAYR